MLGDGGTRMCGEQLGPGRYLTAEHPGQYDLRVATPTPEQLHHEAPQPSGLHLGSSLPSVSYCVVVWRVALRCERNINILDSQCSTQSYHLASLSSVAGCCVHTAIQRNAPQDVTRHCVGAAVCCLATCCKRMLMYAKQMQDDAWR